MSLRIGRNWHRSSARIYSYECNQCKNARNSLYHKGIAWKIKREVFEHYGGTVCSTPGCGVTDLRCLCMDHMNSDGAKMRRAGQPTGIGLYRWLRAHGYPPGYQVLCENCNRIQQHERKEFRK